MKDSTLLRGRTLSLGFFLFRRQASEGRKTIYACRRMARMSGRPLPAVSMPSA